MLLPRMRNNIHTSYVSVGSSVGKTHGIFVFKKGKDCGDGRGGTRQFHLSVFVQTRLSQGRFAIQLAPSEQNLQAHTFPKGCQENAASAFVHLQFLSSQPYPTTQTNQFKYNFFSYCLLKHRCSQGTICCKHKQSLIQELCYAAFLAESLRASCSCQNQNHCDDAS